MAEITRIEPTDIPWSEGVLDGVPSQWSPNMLNTALWLDAADADTITLDVSNNVEQWNDKSGNGRHATQGTAGSRPPYDAANYSVNAADDGKTLSGRFVGITDGTVNEYTLFAVVTPSKTSDSLRSQSSTGTDAWTNSSRLSVFFKIPGNTYSASGPVAPFFSHTTNQLHLVESRNSLAPFNVSRAHTIGSAKTLVSYERKTNRTIRSGINGVYAAGATGSVTNITWDDGAIGYAIPSEYTTSGKWNGKVHEITLVHSGAMASDDINRTEGYLAHKWDFSSALAADHPYKTTPPEITTLALDRYAGVYVSSGFRISPPLDLTSAGIYISSAITWAATVPANTTLTISAAVTNDGENAPEDWTALTSGDPFPDLTEYDSLDGLYLWLKQEFATTDDTVSPLLESLTLGIEGVEAVGTINAPLVSVNAAATTTTVCWGAVDAPVVSLDSFVVSMGFIDAGVAVGAELNSYVTSSEIITGDFVAELPGLDSAVTSSEIITGDYATTLPTLASTVTSSEIITGDVVAPASSVSGVAETAIICNASLVAPVPSVYGFVPNINVEIKSKAPVITATATTVNIISGDYRAIHPHINSDTGVVFSVVAPKPSITATAETPLVINGEVKPKKADLRATAYMWPTMAADLVAKPPRVAGAFADIGIIAGAFVARRPSVDSSVLTHLVMDGNYIPEKSKISGRTNIGAGYQIIRHTREGLCSLSG